MEARRPHRGVSYCLALVLFSSFLGAIVSMVQTPPAGHNDYSEPEFQSTTQLAHSLLRLVLAVRYRRNLVVAVMAAAALLGALYYATAPRRYAAKAGLLVTQIGHDQLDTSITNDESLRQNTMPTFEKMLSSAKVLEGALKVLAPADRVDLADKPPERWIAALQDNLTAKAIRSTSILDVSYRSKDPRAAVNVVRAIVQSYLSFMDRMHKGTAGEMSRMLTKEREEQAEKLSQKQAELLECRRHFADMGFRSDGKTLHPMVQRAVFFNDALIAAQKQRVEHEALLATLQTALQNGEDLGQYMMSVGDTVGREMLLNSLGLSSRDANTQASLEQNLITARADLQTARQNLGPNHPEVISLAEKVRLSQQFLESAQDRIGQRVSQIRKNQLGPWLVQMVQQKLNESRKKEEILKSRFEETRAEAINLSGQLAQIELLERDVKRLGDMNDVLLNQIASLDLKQNGQEVRVAVIEEPVVATRPVSPRLSLVLMITVLGGFSLSLVLVTLLDALDDRFRSIDEMQSRLGLPLLTMVQRLEVPATTGLQALVAHVCADIGRQRGLPHVAHGIDVDASRRPADCRHQRRAGRWQNHYAGKSGGVLRPGRKTNAADRRRPAAPGTDGLGRDARATGLERGSSLRRGHFADGAIVRARVGCEGARCAPFRLAAYRPGGAARQPQILAVAGLGGNRLRRNPHRQSTNAGHHRYGHYRAHGRRRDPGRAAGEEPPPSSNARRRATRFDEDSRVGTGR